MRKLSNWVVPNKNTTTVLFAMVRSKYFLRKTDKQKLTLFFHVCELFFDFSCSCLFYVYSTFHPCPPMYEITRTAFPAPQMLNLAKQNVQTVQSVDLHPEPLPMTLCAPIVKRVNTKTT